MEVIMYILVAVCIALGIFKSYSRNKGNLDFELIAKTCGSLCFVVVGVLAFYLTEHSGKEKSYSLVVILGLILGLIGDIFLCLYDCYSDTKRKNLIQTVGVAFFFLGHLCYMFNFLSLEPFKLYLLPTLIVLPIVYIIFACKVLTSSKAQNVMLCIYYFALNLILTSSINLMIVRGVNAFTLLNLIGCLLFISSDTVLGLSWFAPSLKLPKSYDYYIILSYYAAQCLFALSIFFI
ncbi:MAG: lysoplasmalogenase [Clostridia bacterium]|nr:lysoplasmalogenase [Clostridia bacterium]